ncbi:MAG: RsmE family RNA methyltransferase [Persephonella sp.]|nr:RsmE family RNA methyltransferase [Persephonella sp.]
MGYPLFIGTVKNSQFFIQDEEYHHAKVRRVKEGYRVEINDLNGNIYLGVITQIDKKFIKGDILEKVHVREEKFSINLFLGMPNRLSKIDELIPSITELGVKRLVPVITKNTALKEKDILRKIPKWEKISLNSIKQCRRLFPVQINRPVSTNNVSPEFPIRVVFYEKEKKRTLKNMKVSAEGVDIFVGAEGGITEEEIEMLKSKGFETFSLGPYILRMETAVIAGVCQVNFVFR